MEIYSKSFRKSNRIDELESDKIMHQNLMLEIKKQNLQNQQETEDLEQHGRRLCLRLEGIPTEKNETSDKVLEKITGICKESGVEISDTVIDRAHMIGAPYVDKTTKNHVRESLFDFLLFAKGQYSIE